MEVLNHAITKAFTTETEPYGEPANIVDALYFIGNSIRYLADRLGTGNASTDMGAIELLSKEIKDGLDSLSSAGGSLEVLGGE